MPIAWGGTILDALDTLTHKLLHQRDNTLGNLIGIVPTGAISAYYGTAAPAGWLLCDGAAIPTQYTALIALTGANTPNLKGKVIIAIDGAQTEFDALAKTGGAKTIVIGTANLPTHTHTLNGHAHGGAISGGGLGTHGHTVNSHNHGGGTGVHAHAVTAGLGGGNIGLTAGGSNYNLLEQSKGTSNAGVANTSETPGTDAPNLSHSHNINGDSTNTSDGGFAGTALDKLPPYMAMSYIIKT